MSQSRSRSYAVHVEIEKDGERVSYTMKPSAILGVFTLKKDDSTAYMVGPGTCTCRGFQTHSRCKHGDFVAHFLAGIVAHRDQLAERTQEQAIALRAIREENDRLVEALDDERERTRSMGGLAIADQAEVIPATVEANPYDEYAAADVYDHRRGDTVEYTVRGGQPETCTIESIHDGKARIRRPSGRRQTVPLSRLASTVPL